MFELQLQHNQESSQFTGKTGLFHKLTLMLSLFLDCALKFIHMIYRFSFLHPQIEVYKPNISQKDLWFVTVSHFILTVDFRHDQFQSNKQTCPNQTRKSEVKADCK